MATSKKTTSQNTKSVKAPAKKAATPAKKAAAAKKSAAPKKAGSAPAKRGRPRKAATANPKPSIKTAPISEAEKTTSSGSSTDFKIISSDEIFSRVETLVGQAVDETAVKVKKTFLSRLRSWFRS